MNLRIDGYEWNWQYDGRHHWFDIIKWCNHHIGNSWLTNNYETIYFRSERDYLLFLLRWS